MQRERETLIGSRWQLPALLAAALACGLIAMGTGLRAGVYALPDDARQFLAWTPRLAHPGATTDLIANYWQSVSPPLYRLLFRAASAAGLSPLMVSHLLPIPLLLLSAWLAWRVALKLTSARLPAFLAAAAVLAVIARDPSIFSATPRAFAPPLILLFLDTMLANSWLVVVALLLLAAIYPAPAIVCLTILGLGYLRLRPPFLHLTRRSFAIGAAAVLATAAPVLAFKSETRAWGPTLSLAEARTMPNLMDPKGRSSLTLSDGSLGWLCSGRLGFVPMIVRCRKPVDAGMVLDLLFMLPQLLLAWRTVRRARPDPEGEPDMLYPYALAAALFWYLIAAALAFQLHLPSRYSQHVLRITGALALGHLVGGFLRRQATPIQRAAAATALSLVALASLLLPKTNISRPDDEAAIRLIATSPPGTTVAGVTEDLDYVPALTGRPVLATTEHAIPYHLGYFRPLEQRLAASVEMVTTPDPARLAQLITRWNVGLLVVDADVLRTGSVPQRYATLVPSALLHDDHPPALAQAPTSCTLHRGAIVVISGPCVVASVGARANR